MNGVLHWQISGIRRVIFDRPRIVAILNVTPDSFSDGGLLDTPERALARAARALEEGADGLDVGGESTRPGAAAVPEGEQVRRVVPAVELIRRRLGDGFFITVDTTRAGVARAAFDAGADAVNDVSAGVDDAAMFGLLASARRGVVLMHRLSRPGEDRYSTDYDRPPRYEQVEAGGGGDGALPAVVRAVRAFLLERAGAAERAGIAREAIVLDPGLGFGKSVEQNRALIEWTPSLCELGYPVMSALSRKSFVAALEAGVMSGVGAGAAIPPPGERLAATLRWSAEHIRRGAVLLRVHDVAEHARLVKERRA